MHWFGEVYITLSNEKPFQDVGPLFLLMSAKAFSPTLKDSSQKGLPLVTGLKTFQFPLHTKRPTESSLFLVKIAFVLNTPGNVGTWVYL